MDTVPTPPESTKHSLRHRLITRTRERGHSWPIPRPPPSLPSSPSPLPKPPPPSPPPPSYTSTTHRLGPTPDELTGDCRRIRRLPAR